MSLAVVFAVRLCSVVNILAKGDAMLATVLTGNHPKTFRGIPTVVKNQNPKRKRKTITLKILLMKNITIRQMPTTLLITRLFVVVDKSVVALNCVATDVNTCVIPGHSVPMNRAWTLFRYTAVAVFVLPRFTVSAQWTPQKSSNATMSAER